METLNCPAGLSVLFQSIVSRVMEPKSIISESGKAPAEMRRSAPRKRCVRAIATLMGSSVLSLGVTVLLPDQAQASGLLEHSRQGHSSSLRSAAHFPTVCGEAKARIPGESIEGQSKIDASAVKIGGASSQPAPIEEAGFQSRKGQGEVGSVQTSPNCYGDRSLDLRAKPAFDDGGFGTLPRNRSGFTVPVLGETSGRRRLASPILMLGDDRAHGIASGNNFAVVRVILKAVEEPSLDTSDLSGAVRLTPSRAALISHPSPEIYEGVVPVGDPTGTEKIAPYGALVPLGIQVSGQTEPEPEVDVPDAPERAGDLTLDVTAIAGFETNPFLIELPDTGTASLRLSVVPTFSRQGALGDLRISARIEHIEYARNYDSVQNAGADLGSRFVLSEQVEGTVDLSFDSGVFVTDLTGFGPFDGAPDDTEPLSGVDDITLLGLDQRRTQYQAAGGLLFQLSERDELETAMSFRADRYGSEDSPGLEETDFLSGRVSYAHQVNGELTIGVAFDASEIDFVEQSLGRITTIFPQLIVELSLSPNWQLTGSSGVARIRSSTDSSEETTTAVAGDVSLCRSGVRADFCLIGTRQVVPLGIGGGGLQSRVGASYSYRLSERETLSLSADYGRASETSGFSGSTIETIGEYLRYELDLSERITLSADARYTELRSDLGPDVSNFQALVGLTGRLGRAR